MGNVSLASRCSVFKYIVEALTYGTAALVLVPTRELCVQVSSVAEKLVHRFIWLVPGSLMGGENRSKEKARLRKGQFLTSAINSG